MAEPTVRVSGIVLSSLMFQHVNSDSDVEGFVLGESRFEEQITISDSQADHIHIEETYSVQKHVACHKLNDFYDSVGRVDSDAVKRILADNKQRRNTDQQMTFREKIVHEQLKTSLSNPHVIFVLLTPSKLTPAGSTHRMEYAAFISRSRRFVNVPVLVNNLGLLEQLAYWKVSASCSAVGYDLTMKKHGSKFFSSNGLLREVNEVNTMNDSLQSELQKACGAVEASERLVETLQADVSALRRRLSEKKQSGAGKGSGLFCVSAAADDDPPEQKNNLLLQEAVRALFACSPLFRSQTLTLEAFPVPDVCRSAEQDADVSATTPTRSDTAGAQETLSPLRPGRTNSRKRLKDVLPGTERKRRKSKS
ncbi:BRCA1-A complex subunit Abraxas 1 isoform X3 [Siniperca chuatsi]|uniref:BRCA1-A complex subunit Abraxas 1 isoform X3 n=1 Tax=Siniperca chuatsi TaxID=119488 RepID=UPI001CE0E90E|nr:BRCA1-A complex subunit Abraxas 1 isoform X3 [Siniperca chuatsi]